MREDISSKATSSRLVITGTCQRVLPATADSKGIEQVGEVDKDAGLVLGEFEGRGRLRRLGVRPVAAGSRANWPNSCVLGLDFRIFWTMLKLDSRESTTWRQPP